MLDTEKISKRYLSDVASRLGWDEEAYDIPDEYLTYIREMTPIQFARAYSGWVLGDPYFADMFAKLFDQVNAAEVKGETDGKDSV